MIWLKKKKVTFAGTTVGNMFPKPVSSSKSNFPPVVVFLVMVTKQENKIINERENGKNGQKNDPEF